MPFTRFTGRFCSLRVLADGLNRQGVALRSISSDHPSRFLRYRARQVRLSLGDAAALRHLLDFLRREGVNPAQKMSACQLTPAEPSEHHLREARGLANRNDRQLRSVHPDFSQGSFRRRERDLMGIKPFKKVAFAFSKTVLDPFFSFLHL
jgi:hypothetical protein